MSGAPSLWDEAATASGVSRERGERATKLQPSIFERHGDPFFSALASSFYERAYADADFRVLFANTTREAAERNQCEYLSQIFGDSRKRYAERKGATAIIGRHAPYAIDEKGARTWLRFMIGEAGVDEGALGEAFRKRLCDEETRDALVDYFEFHAYFIVLGRSLVNSGRTVGYYGKHTEGHA